MASVISEDRPWEFLTHNQELAGGTVGVGQRIGGGDVELIEVCAGGEGACIPGNRVGPRGSNVGDDGGNMIAENSENFQRYERASTESEGEIGGGVEGIGIVLLKRILEGLKCILRANAGKGSVEGPKHSSRLQASIEISVSINGY